MLEEVELEARRRQARDVRRSRDEDLPGEVTTFLSSVELILEVYGRCPLYSY